MKETRAAHNGINLDHKAYLIGGWDDKKIEIWDRYTNNSTEHEPLSIDGGEDTALFYARQNFCLNMTIIN